MMVGKDSELHVLIFDEFDAIGKKRGALEGIVNIKVLMYSVI